MQPGLLAGALELVDAGSTHYERKETMGNVLSFAVSAADIVPLADWSNDDGPHWWFVFWPLTWFLVIAAIVFLVRGRRGWRGPRSFARHDRESGIELLERRFAEGELSPEQYRERRSVLEPDKGM
jgi:putative membrane protein